MRGPPSPCDHRVVDVTVRAIRTEEIPAWTRTDAAGFGESAEELGKRERWLAEELDRTRAAFEGDDLVATSRNRSFELTVPGGATIPASGVTAVAVLPTHRRRGILRSMMTALLDESVARDESVSMLTASEGGIYGRFGYGASTLALDVTLAVRELVFALPRPGGRLRMVERAELDKVAPAVFDRVRRGRPGAVSRPEAWWADIHGPQQSEGNRFDVLFEGPDGQPDGFVTYTIKDKWIPNPEHELHVHDLVAASPVAEHALWRFLCEVDLVRTLFAPLVPMDTSLPWLLASPRAALFQPSADFVWTRVLDVPAALGVRTYPVPGRLTLEVHDPTRPGGAADGTYVVEGGPDGAAVTPTSAAPDLTCDVGVLSTAWLGGVRWSTLVAAGRAEQHTAGSAVRADAMFSSSPLPFPYTWF